jgi:hypothetical protein
MAFGHGGGFCGGGFHGGGFGGRGFGGFHGDGFAASMEVGLAASVALVVGSLAVVLVDLAS